MTRLKKGCFFTTEAQRSREIHVFEFGGKFADKLADTAT